MSERPGLPTCPDCGRTVGYPPRVVCGGGLLVLVLGWPCVCGTEVLTPLPPAPLWLPDTPRTPPG